MFVRRKRAWELPESAATDETLFRDRRRLIKAAAAGSIAAASAGLPLGAARAQVGAPEDDPSKDLYPLSRNDAYKLQRPISSEEVVATYNNYYEFGSSKTIWRAAQDLPIRPWTVQIDGAVEQPREIGIDELLNKMPLEERLYRHRCVEAWSIAVPWSGFPMKALVDFARPLSKAKYVKMVTFEMPDVAKGQRASWYPWPYVEGLTIEEATNELAFLVTGMYGKPIPKQNGSPLRLAVPWKYGFKSVKGIVRFSFVEEMPKTYWWEIQPNEYGFWANVNPEVDHPRWSQASEKFLKSMDDIGTFASPERVPTQLYNGYAEQVAHLYTGLEDKHGDRLFR
ncbi:MAG: protein-methionine-sulfoxide reductase catalytic subunit MsrP [Rhodovibrionaceae bacterium]|nr:protein-methionine-sulfoxide reductase catalytic subunit MsrP [Rhodovibrionaceae bacterium]